MTHIGIIDYGMGNISSVANAVEYCGYSAVICQKPQELNTVDKLILPGVGAFGDCMKNLHALNWVDDLNETVIHNKKPILGICLGMQVMASKGYETGETDGLGWFDAEVIRIPHIPGVRVPHVGWNSLQFSETSFLFNGLDRETDVYFVHSYYMKCRNRANVIATTEYGISLTAAVHKENIVATQFHPEKSQDIGLTILQNYLHWRP